MNSACTLGAADAAQAIRDGELKSEELVEACLKRIEEFGPTVKAWTNLDPDHAMAQARAADQLRYDGKTTGALNNGNIGIKDSIVTSNYPTR